MKLAFLILSFFCASGFSATFRVAAIYPVTQTAGHQNCTCGAEAACITEAVIKEARSGGLDISMSLLENHRNPLEAARVAKKLIADRFDAAIGTLVSTDALVVSRETENGKVPFIVPTASHVDITRGKKFVARISFNDKRQAELLARLATSELKAKKIYILRNHSNPYSDYLAAEFNRQVGTTANTQVLSTFDGFGGFSEAARQIVDSKVGLVFAPIAQEQIASLYVELLNQNASLTLLTSDVIEKEPQFLPRVKASKRIRFIYPQHWNGSQSDPRAKHYLALHSRYCGSFQPSMTSAAAYDAIQALVGVLKRDPKVRGEALVKAIKKSGYEGVTGTLRSSTDGDPLKPLELFEVVDGKARYWRRWQ